jgi:hypothetical protein
MCFQIRAVRDDVESDFSPVDTTEVCDETEPETVEPSAPPGVPAPDATVAPDMEEAEGGGEPTGEGANGSGGGGDGDAAPPEQFITVLRVFTADTPAAETEQQRLAGLGVDVKLLDSTDYGLTVSSTAPSPTTAPPSPSPTPSGEAFFFLYLDGPSAAESETACNAAVASIEAAGEAPPSGACIRTFEVTSRPSGEPTPTGGASPSL